MSWVLRTGIALLALALAIGAELIRPEFVTRVDEGLRDIYLRLAATKQPEDRLVVIDIDESSLSALGP